MTFDQIQSFYLVATMGTYQKAAQRLNATQPAISARIVALENWLGVKLFDRSGHRVALTPQGRKFLSYAEKLLEIRAEAQFEVGQGGELGGVVRIGASDTMATTWLPDFLVSLGTQFPETTFELSVGPSVRLRDELINQQLDICFIVGPVSNPEIVNHPLCECPMVLAAAPSLGLHNRRLALKELETVNILTFERVTQPFQDLKRDLRAAGVSPRLNPISSLQTIVLLTRKGLGIGAVPMAVVDEELRSDALKLLETEIQLSSLQFAICHRDGPDAPAMQTIVNSALAFTRAMGSAKSIKMIY
ncbi:HTH-type transcriptional regulator GltR (plasmid) [Pseudosulfitobacter pseudonitzschiae]|uniref:HTH-type transcriptional regulator GltR n=2 Tax=Pseudosulfitobacter pseudonitzschiae TaxID=1402135 RepID=A0A221K9F4_9RHOB|nr:HTH-type transcriptional regulator GltR [Pseudosulfitobacter pseudonitzschiae]